MVYYACGPIRAGRKSARPLLTGPNYGIFTLIPPQASYSRSVQRVKGIRGLLFSCKPFGLFILYQTASMLSMPTLVNK